MTVVIFDAKHHQHKIHITRSDPVGLKKTSSLDKRTDEQTETHRTKKSS